MSEEELTEEDVFTNDIDPLEGIRQIRKSQGADVDPELVDDTPLQVDSSEDESEEEDNLEEFTGEADEEVSVEGKSDPVESKEEAEESETKAEEEGDGKEPSEEETADSEEPETNSEAEILKFRANGQDFEFTKDEVVSQFETVFGQAMDYTKKMQKIAPYRKMISALESEGITQEQLNVAIDALKGDAGAIRKLVADNKIDTFDLTEGEDTDPYQAKSYGKDETQLAIEEITSRISADEEFKLTVDVIDNQWDDKSREAVLSNPSVIAGLHNDIKSGVYDKVAPIATKMRVLDGNTKSNIEYYVLAGQQYAQQQAAEKEKQAKSAVQQVEELNKKAQDAEQEFEAASSEAKAKRAASSTGARADRKGVVDYLDDNDEDFDAWYNSVMNNR